MSEGEGGRERERERERDVCVCACMCVVSQTIPRIKRERGSGERAYNELFWWNSIIISTSMRILHVIPFSLFISSFFVTDIPSGYTSMSKGA